MLRPKAVIYPFLAPMTALAFTSLTRGQKWVVQAIRRQCKRSLPLALGDISNQGNAAADIAVETIGLDRVKGTFARDLVSQPMYQATVV